LKSIELDYSKRCADEPEKGHNRWHPDIPPAVEAEPGEEVVLQTRHAFDGGVNPTSTASDLRDVDLNVVHPLTGPVYVQGAEPGDLLEVNILRVEPASWGFTTIIPGFGFLRDLFLEPYVVHWNIRDMLAGGGFKLGEHLVLPAEKGKRILASNLLLSILQNFGLEVDRFGNSSGTLRGLEVG